MLQLAIYIRNKAGDGLGFQENYYFPGTDPINLLSSVIITSPGGGLNSRAAFLSKSCEIYAVRASVVGGVKIGKLTKFPTPIAGAVNSFMSDIEDCISYFGFNAAHSAKRQYHFRGIGESWLLSSELSPTGVSALPIIQTWFGNLLGWGEKIYVPASLGKRDVVAITKTSLTAPLHLTLNTPITLTGKTSLRLTAVRASPQVNGLWLTPGTAGLSSTDITLAGSEQFTTAAGAIGKANFFNTTVGDGESRVDYEFNGVSSKKTGRVSFLRRGRRSARQTRR